MLTLESEIDITKFFKWWGQQLSLLLPQKMRDSLKNKGLLVININEKAATVGYELDQYQELLGEFECNALGQEELQSLIQSDAKYADTHVVLRVPEHLSLIQDIVLPVAAESNLAQVISYELDRYTPFTKEEVYFSCIKQKVEKNKVQLPIRLALVKKTTLDTMYEQCLHLGLKPAFADSESSCTGTSYSYNLLPKELCLKTDRKPLFIMIGSLFIALALLVVLLVLPLNMGDKGLNKLKQHARNAGNSARTIEGSKKAIDYLYQTTQLVIDHKNSAPSMIDVVDTLSEVLGNDTWVSRFRYSNKILRLTGQSENASSLIASLEAMPIFHKVTFISPVTKDRRSGLERFQISITVIKKQTNAKAE